MRKVLKPGLLLTATACAGVGSPSDGPEGPTRNPPPLRETSWSYPKPPFTPGQGLMLRDDQGREIFGGSGNCWIQLPFETPPTSVVPPPTEAVSCPEPMRTDPAWAGCAGGTIYLARDGESGPCTCYFFGNPPPAPTAVACPSVPGLTDSQPMGTGKPG